MKLIKVTEIRPAESRAPTQYVWVTFQANEKALEQLRVERYDLFHVSSTDTRVKILIESPTRQTEAKLLKEMSTSAIEAQLKHRG